MILQIWRYGPSCLSGTALGAPGILRWELGSAIIPTNQSLVAHPLPQVRNPYSRERAAGLELSQGPGHILTRPFSSIPTRKGSPCCPCSLLDCSCCQPDSHTARPGRGVLASVSPGTGAGLQFCCCSVTQPCPTLCKPTDCSMSGFSVLHYLPEFAQTHVH